ncbi:uncharacterized protein LOC110686268 [Chenopodium quinoa]|uniref:uncharacterized protein LOC110686268 n=1 Tax=Chenopodium quinoa TaxID=63459 RepID=UPI000B7719B9|nr:uncharacterized protein LOC110686268 [Chenopodium quinoa]
MGNGHFSSEGYRRSCNVRDMKYYDKSGSEIRPTINELLPLVSQTSCYDLKMETRKMDSIDQIFLFLGGPGCADSSNQVGDEDIIDCIDVHKQLALTHPLLKNHNIQMEPRTYPSTLKSMNETFELKQSWHKYGRCPYGSIPISRKYSAYNSSNVQRKSASPFAEVSPNLINIHKYAMIQIKAGDEPGKFRGVHGVLNVWNPVVNPIGLSLSQIWVVSGDANNLNTIEAGWRVHPSDSQSRPRLFIYWTRDNYMTTGCYDLTCPGFVQTNKDFAVGAYIDSSSVYGGIQKSINLYIYRDSSTKDWWLTYGGKAMGYWPASLFTSMTDKGGDIVAWGGEVADEMAQGNNTITQMGSGHFSNEGFGKSCYIRDLFYVDYADNNFKEVHPKQEDFEVLTSVPKCYDSRFVQNAELRFYFGGPGCQPT